jgi:hypothetical protein
MTSQPSPLGTTAACDPRGAPWERLLPVGAQRCLALLRQEWRSRPEGQSFVVATYDGFSGAGVARSDIRASLDVLVEMGLIERLSVASGRCGHPASAFRLVERN